MNILLPPLLPPSTHTINFCSKHPSQRVVGVCGSCLTDKLTSLASAYTNFSSVSPASASPEVLHKDSVHHSSDLVKQSRFVGQQIKPVEEHETNSQVVNREIKEVISVNDSSQEQGNSLSESENGSSSLIVNESNMGYDESGIRDGSTNLTDIEEISANDEVQENRDCIKTEELEADGRDREAGEIGQRNRGDEVCVAEGIEEVKPESSNGKVEKSCRTGELEVKETVELEKEEPEELEEEDKEADEKNSRNRGEIGYGDGKQSVQDCVVVGNEGASAQKVTLKSLFDMEDQHYSESQKIIEAGDSTPVGNSCRCVCVNGNGNGGDVSKYSVIFDSLLCRSRKKTEVRDEEVIKRIIKEAEVIKRNAELIRKEVEAINRSEVEFVKRKADVIKREADGISDEISKVVSDPGVIKDGIKRRMGRSASVKHVIKDEREVISRAISDTQVIKDSVKDLEENRGAGLVESAKPIDRESRRRLRKQELARRIREEVHEQRRDVAVPPGPEPAAATLEFEGRQLPVIYGRSLSWNASWAEKAAQQAARRQQVLPEYKAWAPYFGSPGFKRSASGGHYKKAMASSSRGGGAGSGVGGGRAPVSAAAAGAPPFFLRFYVPPLARSRSKAAFFSRSGAPKRRRFWSMFLFS